MKVSLRKLKNIFYLNWKRKIILNLFLLLLKFSSVVSKDQKMTLKRENLNARQI